MTGDGGAPRPALPRRSLRGCGVDASSHDGSSAAQWSAPRTTLLHLSQVL
jgi:hypothetical protein